MKLIICGLLSQSKGYTNLIPFGIPKLTNLMIMLMLLDSWKWKGGGAVVSYGDSPWKFVAATTGMRCELLQIVFD